MEDITAVPAFTEDTIKKRGIPGSTLKLIAIFVMLIDHVAATILEQTLISNGYFNYNAVASTDASNVRLYFIYFVMRMIGRLGFPLFCFLLVEGFVHTRNKGKYAIRLALFSFISEIPFDLAFQGKIFYFGYQNVFFTLFIGFLVMWGFQFFAEWLKEKRWFPVISVIGVIGAGWIAFQVIRNSMYTINSIVAGFNGTGLPLIFTSMDDKVMIGVIAIVAVIFLVLYLMFRSNSGRIGIFLADCAVLAVGMVLANLLVTDYSAFGVLTIAVMYALRRKYLSAGIGGYITLNIMSLSELTAAFALIPIGMYNGERGLRLKYVFYAFYPVHLFILYLICKAMNLM